MAFPFPVSFCSFGRRGSARGASDAQKWLSQITFKAHIPGHSDTIFFRIQFLLSFFWSNWGKKTNVKRSTNRIENELMVRNESFYLECREEILFHRQKSVDDEKNKSYFSPRNWENYAELVTLKAICLCNSMVSREFGKNT